MTWSNSWYNVILDVVNYITLSYYAYNILRLIDISDMCMCVLSVCNILRVMCVYIYIYIYMNREVLLLEEAPAVVRADAPHLVHGQRAVLEEFIIWGLGYDFANYTFIQRKHCLVKQYLARGLLRISCTDSVTSSRRLDTISYMSLCSLLVSSCVVLV